MSDRSVSSFSTPNPLNHEGKGSSIWDSNSTGGFVFLAENSTPEYTTHTDDYGNKYYLMIGTPRSKELTFDELDDRVGELTERKQIT